MYNIQHDPIFVKERTLDLDELDRTSNKIVYDESVVHCTSRIETLESINNTWRDPL